MSNEGFLNCWYLLLAEAYSIYNFKGNLHVGGIDEPVNKQAQLIG
jgi:hypothetical protein